MTITEAVLKHYADKLLARNLRLAVVQNQYDAGNLTEAEALELLAGPHRPGPGNRAGIQAALQGQAARVCHRVYFAAGL